MPLFAHGRWTSRLARLATATLGLLVVLIALAWFGGKPYLEHVIRRKLQELVAQQLNATLELGPLYYRWPYGVEAHDAALVSNTPDEPSIKLVGFKRFDLQLAQSPLRKGPLIIERAEVTSPTLYVVEDKQHGFIGLEHLFKTRQDKQKDQQTPKLSDVLRLKYVQLTDARVEYDDRTIRKSVPFVWDKLDLRLDGERLSDSAYHFQAGAGNGDTTRIDLNGQIDVDALVLTLDSLSLTAKVSPGTQNSPLPAGVQRVLNTLGVRGGGRASITGTVPFEHVRDMDLHGDFVIDDAQGRLSPEGRPLSDLDIAGKLRLHGRDVTVDVDRFVCHRGATAVSILPATVQYSIPTDKWTVTPVRAAVAWFPPPYVSGTLNQRATVMVVAEVTELDARDRLRVVLSGTRILLPDTAGAFDVDGAVRYDDDGITVEAVRLSGAGGTATVAGLINENVAAFAGEVTVSGMELDAINRIIDPGSSRSLQGKLSGNVKAAATDSLDAVKGQGRFRVTGGRFAKVPILGGLSEAMKMGQNAFVAHEAAGRFTLDKDKVTFQRLAVSTDVFSAIGTGDIAFDGNLDLSVYADGHWKRPKPGDVYIPLLSDLGRAIARTGEYAFGSVSRQITHFTIRGTTEKPKITPSPAPVITEGFERALRDE